MSIALLVLTVVVFCFLLLTVPENRLMLNWLALISAACATGTLLARQGFHQFNQFLLSSGLSLVVLFATVHSKLVNTDMIHDGSYFNPRYFLIGLSFIPFVVFDIKRQKWPLLIGTAVNLAALICYIPIHQICGADPESIMGHGLENNVFVTVASSSAAVAICAGMFFLKRANGRYESHIEGLVEETTRQNNELTASIRYARSLQEAVLKHPKPESLDTTDWSVFERPRDTLSGDFFLLEETQGKTLAAVVDCTGHGVPGAFVSLMASTGLQQSIAASKDVAPDAILNDLQGRMQDQLSQQGHTGFRDGMDMAFCQIDHSEKRLTYASALGIAYIIRGSTPERLSCDRNSIGSGSTPTFTLFESDYQPGDLLVLMSDGFKDQFGGDKLRKFSRRRLEGLLEEIGSLSPEAGIERMKRVFDHWKGNQEQTDDICVLVLRLS